MTPARAEHHWPGSMGRLLRLPADVDGGPAPTGRRWPLPADPQAAGAGPGRRRGDQQSGVRRPIARCRIATGLSGRQGNGARRAPPWRSVHRLGLLRRGPGILGGIGDGTGRGNGPCCRDPGHSSARPSLVLGWWGEAAGTPALPRPRTEQEDQARGDSSKEVPGSAHARHRPVNRRLARLPPPCSTQPRHTGRRHAGDGPGRGIEAGHRAWGLNRSGRSAEPRVEGLRRRPVVAAAKESRGSHDVGNGRPDGRLSRRRVPASVMSR